MAAAVGAVALNAYAQQIAPPLGAASKPVRFIVAQGPGGTTDLIARVLAPEFAARLGRSVVVENKTGANGLVGEQFVAEAEPDGSTLLFQAASIAVNPNFYKTSYSVTDFAAISQVADVPLVAVVHPSVPVKNVTELVALLKAQGKDYPYGSWGTGGFAHLAGELFKLEAKVNIEHVPYKAVGQLVIDLIGGHIRVSFIPLSVALPHLKSGSLRGLALTDKQRSPLAPDIPTMVEAGLPTVQVLSWIGMFAPARTPQPVVNWYFAALADAIQKPIVRAAFDKAGLRVIGNSPAEFSQAFQSDISKYKKVVKDANITVQQ